MIEEYHPNCELKGLTIEDAANLLRSRVDARLIEAGIYTLMLYTVSMII